MDPPAAGADQLSPDGQWLWDGQRWVSAGQAAAHPHPGGTDEAGLLRPPQEPPIGPPDAPHGAPPGPPASGSGGDSWTKRIDVLVGIFSGVLTVLSLVGLTFLPADTLAEKAYVILACLALSLAAVTGIDAWRDAARFRLTAMSTVVAIVCLAALSMAAQREQPSPPAPQPSHAASLTTPSTSGSPAPTPSPTDLPSPPLTPTPSASSPASSGLTVHDGGATVTGCGINTEGRAFANLSITNHTSANTTFYVYVGFYQGGNQFTDSVQTLTIGAGSTYLATIDSIATPPGQGTVSCKVLKLND